MINDPHAKVSLAYDENKIVGFSIAYMRRNKEIPIFQKRTYIDIDAIGVVEEYRKKGIGSLLFSEIENWAKNHAISDFQLNVWEFNQNAQDFYKKHGFETVSRIMRKS